MRPATPGASTTAAPGASTSTIRRPDDAAAAAMRECERVVHRNWRTGGWRVLSRRRLAILDADFALWVGRFPEVTSKLIDRVAAPRRTAERARDERFAGGGTPNQSMIAACSAF
jgi:hypothetical protein